MADFQILLDILDGKIAPEADSVVHLGEIDPDDENIRIAWTPEYMSACARVLHQLDGMTPAQIGALTKADIEELVYAEMCKRGRL